MIEKIQRSIYYILFFFTPLLMFPLTSELFEFNKIMLIYVAASLSVFLLLFRAILGSRLSIKRSPLDWPILIFIATQIISTSFSIDPHTSIFGYYGRFNGGLLSQITYITLFYIFITTFKKDDIDKLLRTSLLSSALVVLWGLPGKFGYDMSCLLFLGQWNNSCWVDQFRPAERMFSTLGQPNWLGAYLAINFFIGVYFLIVKMTGPASAQPQRRSASLVSSGLPVLRHPSFIWQLYLILNFAGILFTRSRSAYIALGAGLAVFVLLMWKQKKEIFMKLKPVLIGALVVFLLSIIPASVFQPQRSSLKSPSSVQSTDVTESGDIRKIVWQGAWELGQRYPLFGTGVETFAYSYNFVRPRAHNLTSEWDFIYNKAHNEYLNFLATTGFVGLSAYLLMIAAVIFTFKFLIFNQTQNSNDKVLRVALLSSYTTILITNFFGFSTTTINLLFYLIPGILIVSRDKNDNVLIFEISKNRVMRLALMVTLAITALYMALFLINYYRADMIYSEAESFAKIEDYTAATPLYDRALKLHYEHVYQDKLSGMLASLAVLSSYQNEKETGKKLVAASQALNNASLRASRHNVLYLKTKSKNNYLYYQIDNDKKYLEEAVAALKLAAQSAPTDPRIPYTLAVFYSLLGDKETALSEVGRSINLKSNYTDAHDLRKQLLE